MAGQERPVEGLRILRVGEYHAALAEIRKLSPPVYCQAFFATPHNPLPDHPVITPIRSLSCHPFYGGPVFQAEAVAFRMLSDECAAFSQIPDIKTDERLGLGNQTVGIYWPSAVIDGMAGFGDLLTLAAHTRTQYTPKEMPDARIVELITKAPKALPLPSIEELFYEVFAGAISDDGGQLGPRTVAVALENFGPYATKEIKISKPNFDEATLEFFVRSWIFGGQIAAQIYLGVLARATQDLANPGTGERPLLHD